MWHNINTQNRILHWREWRHRLNLLSFEEALQTVATDWMKAPRVNHYLVQDQIDDWPSPWELINDNLYCDLGICLGMFYSLILSDHSLGHNITINLYDDDVAQDWYNLVSIDSGKYMLNWAQGSIVNNSTLPSTARLIYQYTRADLLTQLK